MYLRRCYRAWDGKRHAYWALVRSVRTAKGPRQEVVAYLGPSGCGKTLALRAIEADKPGTILISIETAAATGPGIIDDLAKAVRTRSRPTGFTSRHILPMVKEALAGTARLIIFDEVHKLCTGTAAADDKVLTILRDLHDHTGVPMLLCGTTDLVAYLERQQAKGKEPLSQIRRRIGICRDLSERTTGDDGGPGEPLFTLEETRRVFAKSKMRIAADAARYLMMLANTAGAGGLGTCSNLVAMAMRVNERNADTLTADMLRAVHRLLINRRAFAAIDEQLQQQNTRRPAVKAG